jgi:hypothetical protein
LRRTLSSLALAAGIAALAADALVAPLAQGGVYMVPPELLITDPELQVRDDRRSDLYLSGSLPDEEVQLYDVDKGGALVAWLRSWGSLYVVDGHRRRALAILATNFVSSKLGGESGDQVPVRREVPVRVLLESDGWSRELVVRQARRLNGIPEVAGDSCAEALAADGFEILASDGVTGGIMRVRQKATRADSRNKNRRVYPRDVLQAAIDAARPLARGGGMLCEYRHPDVAVVKGEERFVDNPDRKSARVDDISDVGADGWVYVTRTILDTPEGRRLKARFDAKNPPGISTRFKVRTRPGKVAGDSVQVATSMAIYTWDDVEDPAVDGAGSFELLTDSVLRRIHEADGTDGRDPAQGNQTPRMKETILKKRTALLALIAASAAVDAVAGARKAYHDAIEGASSLGIDATELQDLRVQAAKDDAEMVSAGYRPGAPAPTFVDPKQGEPGYAPDTEANNNPAPRDPTPHDLRADDVSTVVKMAQREREREAREKLTNEIRTKLESDGVQAKLSGLPESLREKVRDHVLQIASDAAGVDALVDGQVEILGKALADERLRNGGVARGATTEDPATPGGARVKTGAKPWMENVDRLNAAADDMLRASGAIDPSDPEVKRLRAHNEEAFLNPLMEGIARSAGCDSTERWVAENDAFFGPEGQQAVTDSLKAAGDATTTANMLNQPTIAMFVLYQRFWDSQAIQYVAPFGPGSESASWEQFQEPIGSVMRVPVETYTGPGGYGASSQYYDAGLLTPENTGIDEASLGLTWLPFAAQWRRIAINPTRDLIKAMGNGPANIAAVARMLMHSSRDAGRRIDRALLNEMVLIADEYGAASVAGESYTTGNNQLPNQSVFGAGSISVNLNPTKVASAAIAATDPQVKYGANVLAALRLRTGQAGTANPYFGHVDSQGIAWGSVPLVRPRTVVDLVGGVATATTKNALTVTAPAAMVEGYLDDNLQIQAKPGAPNPTFAVDWERGVIVFNAAAGLAGGGGVVTTTITLSYSYATNFDVFNLSNPTLAAGQTYEMYLSSLLRQIDQTAAYMGSYPRYMAPNLGLMSLNAAAKVTSAQTFFQWASPKGTELYPTPSYFASRNGINHARLNAPWFAGDNRILLTRKGSTRYGIDTPWEVKGPFPKYEPVTGKIVASEVYYGQENSAIGTPQVQDLAGTVINPVGRTILLK